MLVWVCGKIHAQEAQEQTVALEPLVAMALNEASRSWFEDLNLKINFELTWGGTANVEEGLAGKFINRSDCRCGQGEYVFGRKALKAKTVWGLIDVDGTQASTGRNYEFVAFNNVGLWLTPELSMVGPSLFGVKNRKVRNYREGAIFYRLENLNCLGEIYPLNSIPNPFAFMAGSEIGVAFDGANLGQRTALIIRDHVLHGESKFPSSLKTSIDESADEIVVDQELVLNGVGQIQRRIRFRYFRGLPLRVWERYRQWDLKDDPATTPAGYEYVAFASEFDPNIEQPVPRRFQVVTSAAGGKRIELSDWRAVGNLSSIVQEKDFYASKKVTVLDAELAPSLAEGHTNPFEFLPEELLPNESEANGDFTSLDEIPNHFILPNQNSFRYFFPVVILLFLVVLLCIRTKQCTDGQ